MIEKFLKAKHWQLFGLMFGLPMIFQFIIMGTMMANIGSMQEPEPSNVFNSMKLFPIIMIVYMGVFFGWFWSIAIGLQVKIPQNIKMKVKNFKIFFFIPLFYLTVLSVLISIMFMRISDGNGLGGGVITGQVGIIIPLHLLSIFSMFYILYFVSKTIKTVELQREVSFGDYAGEFFMIWFYPIGIWIIQPKLNKMFEK
jgi:hypothetical protein